MFQNLFNKEGSDGDKRLSEEVKKSVDVLFAENFKAKGGKFIYCTSSQESIATYSIILEENNWINKQGVCYSDKLLEGLSGFGIQLQAVSKKKTATFLVTHCESLVSDTGSILLSSRQISEKRISDLPQNFIVFASTSQIVQTLSEGLKVINSQGAIPTNITSVDNFSAEKKQKQGLVNYMGTSKCVYLLLIENL